MPCTEHAAKRERARELRRTGWSRAQISRELGVRNSGALTNWLKDIPAPRWTRRPRAKDEHRARAIALRREGKSYSQIQQMLDVSRSSLSLWLRDVALTDEQQRVLDLRRKEPSLRRAASLRALRIARTEFIRSQARSEIGELTSRQLFIAGVVAYWAEGEKAKPWRPTGERVSFINSDPTMIRLFLEWTKLLGIGKDDLILRISIHEKADVSAALAFWSNIVGVSSESFKPASLKRHNPSTVRHNKGDSYFGCLTITVRRSTNLYRQVEGWYEGIMSSLARGVMAARHPLEVSGLGSNPSAPATAQTLFEPTVPYQCRVAI